MMNQFPKKITVNFVYINQLLNILKIRTISRGIIPNLKKPDM